MQKNIAFEGVRGIAAVIVVLWHCHFGFFNWINPDGQLWSAAINGPASVILFFVLSGYVLTRRPLIENRAMPIVRSAIKRWPRLAGPVTAAMLCSCVLVALNLYHSQPAAAVLNSSWLHAHFPFSHADFPRAFYQGVAGSFFSGEHYYDPPLWTMHYEFVGSFLAFVIALLTIATRRMSGILSVGVPLLGVAFCWSQDVNYVAFAIGVCLAAFLPSSGRLSAKWAALMMIAGIYLFGYFDSSGWYSIVPKAAANDVGKSVVYILASALIFAAIETCEPVKRALSNRFMAFLGWLSFPLYLVHILVLCSLGCGVYLSLQPHNPLLASWIAACATFCVAIIAALPIGIFNAEWVSLLNKAFGLRAKRQFVDRNGEPQLTLITVPADSSLPAGQ
jgi:peptidoglycan/LPS O-acetylase OafA/YrhL